MGEGEWRAVKGNVSHCFPPCPHPQDTQTHSTPTSAQTNHGLSGVKRRPRRREGGRERLSQKGDPSPLQRPFRNKINGMCLSIISGGLGGRLGGGCGGFCPSCPASPTWVTMATKAPCCLGDGSRSRNPYPVSKSGRLWRWGCLGQRGREWGFFSGGPSFCLSSGIRFLWETIGGLWKKIHSEPGNRQKRGLRGRGEGEAGLGQNADQD